MLASLVAGRLRVPGLLLFLFLGMAIGSDGLGLIDFSDYRLARRIGIIALALILFEGGLTSGLLEIRPVLTPALSLALVGTIVTAVVTGLAAVWLFDLSTLDGLLLGSVLAATASVATGYRPAVARVTRRSVHAAATPTTRPTARPIPSWRTKSTAMSAIP